MNYRYLLLLLFMAVPLWADDIQEMNDVAYSLGTVNVSELPDVLEDDLGQRSPESSALSMPFLPIPTNLPVPDDLYRDIESSTVEDSDLEHDVCECMFKKSCCNLCINPRPNIQEIVPTPLPAQPIPGTGDSGTRIPPDTQGAVGPNNLVITLNDVMVVQTRAGAVQKRVTLNSFWAALGNPTTFDPRITYDPYGKRWIFIVAANSHSATSALLIAVSQTTNPLGLWNRYRIDADGANRVWIDNPTVGFNRNWITVQGNMFNVSNDAFARSNIYVFNKARLYARLTPRFKLFTSSTIGASQIPAQTYSPTLTTQYLVQTWNGNSAGQGLMRIYQITGALGMEVFTPLGFVISPSPWQSTHPIINKGFAPQRGTTLRIMNNDDRNQKTIYRNGALWATHTIFLPASGTPTHSAVQWWQFYPNGRIRQRGRIEDPLATATNGRFFYAFPSIDVNRQGDAMVGYSRFSSSTFASAAFSYRLGTDRLNSMRAPIVYKNGLAVYTKDFGSGQIRWGDYSNTVVDPVNDRFLWTIQEYASTLSGSTSRWAVEWYRLPFAARGFEYLNDDESQELL